MVSRLCDQYGIAKNTQGLAHRNYALSNGQVMKSSYEQRAGDWLLSRSVPFVYEPQLEFNRRFRADFLANGWYVEIWGVTNKGSYKAKREKKTRYYQFQKLPLIQIENYDFDNGRENWSRKLAKCLDAPDSPNAFAFMRE